MMWQYLAAAAAPMVLGSFMKKPKAPGAPAGLGVDRSGYVNQLLNMGFNPNSEQYRMASDIAMEQVNRALARQGLAGSSVGGQLAANMQAKLASDFMNEQLSRGRQALESAMNYDQGRAGAAMSQYNIQRQGYEDAMRRQQGVMGGIGSLASAALGGWMANNEMEQRVLDREAYGRSMYGGSPGYSPSSPAPIMPYQSQLFGPIGG